MATSTLGSGTLVLAGTTSGTTTVTATAVAGTTTLTLPAATDTLVGKATTDTLTNKTLTTPSVSSPTISDGTANGVAFLNGSKVLTTGSALVFDGTNLGIGTSSPGSFAAAGRNLVVGTGTGNNGLTIYSGNASGGNIYFADGTTGAETYAGFIQYSHSTNAMLFGVNNTGSEAMTLDASGNLGIGTSSPAQKLHVKTSTSATPITLGVLSNATGLPALSFNGAYASTTMAGIYANGATSTSLYYEVPSGNSHFFGIADSTKMTLDSSGNLLVGTTSATGKVGIEYDGGVVVCQNLNDSANTNNSTFVQFTIQGTQVGTIKRVGTTSAVVYNTSSDYRLKTVVGAVTGQGDRIDALKPINYLWKEGNTSARGFLAHEFQEVYANSVSGDKDAVDANGNPVYQAMQASTSEVIADLVAEIQSLRKRLAAAGI